MKALEEASRAQSTLLVTHQLEDTLGYDQIWVMDNGRLIQQGDYSTLSQSAGSFANLLSQRNEEL